MRYQCGQGLTLLQMSMVLLVIALIVGGITVGKNFVRAGQLQSVVKDSGRYQQAIQDFQDKYHTLPGNMANAESFWRRTRTVPTQQPM
jgi:hypothetical protein